MRTVVRKKRHLFYTTIYRELALDPAATWKTAENVDGGSEIE